MKVLFDHNLSPRVARAIHILVEPEDMVFALSEKFSPSVTDLEWIGTLGHEGGWAVVSGDRSSAASNDEKSTSSKGCSDG